MDLPTRSACLLDAIAESSAIDPNKIRETWVWRRKNFGEIYAQPSEEMAADEVATIAKVRAAFLENIGAIRTAADDSEVSEAVGSIIGHLDRGGSAAYPTAYADRGRRSGFPSFNVLAGGPGSLALEFAIKTVTEVKMKRFLLCTVALIAPYVIASGQEAKEKPALKELRGRCHGHFYFTAALAEEDDKGRMALLTKAIEQDPKLARAFYNRGNIYARQDKLALAKADFQKAVELKDDYIHAHYNLACILSLESRSDGTGRRSATHPGRGRGATRKMPPATRRARRSGT